MTPLFRIRRNLRLIAIPLALIALTGCIISKPRDQAPIKLPALLYAHDEKKGESGFGLYPFAYKWKEPGKSRIVTPLYSSRRDDAYQTVRRNLLGGFLYSSGTSPRISYKYALLSLGGGSVTETAMNGRPGQNTYWWPAFLFMHDDGELEGFCAAWVLYSQFHYNTPEAEQRGEIENALRTHAAKQRANKDDFMQGEKLECFEYSSGRLWPALLCIDDEDVVGTLTPKENPADDVLQWERVKSRRLALLGYHESNGEGRTRTSLFPFLTVKHDKNFSSYWTFGGLLGTAKRDDKRWYYFLWGNIGGEALPFVTPVSISEKDVRQ